MANNKITIYTDGAAQGNPGRGGYGVVLLSPPYRKELSEGFRLTTNNRMELLAVIKGLETLKFDGCEVTVFSDSRYVVDAVTKGWVFGWEKKGYKDKKNPDLWRRFMVLYRKHHVRGSRQQRRPERRRRLYRERGEIANGALRSHRSGPSSRHYMPTGNTDRIRFPPQIKPSMAPKPCFPALHRDTDYPPQNKRDFRCPITPAL